MVTLNKRGILKSYISMMIVWLTLSVIVMENVCETVTTQITMALNREGYREVTGVFGTDNQTVSRLTPTV